LKMQPKHTNTSKSAEKVIAHRTQGKIRNKQALLRLGAMCVCCERPFNPKSLPIHHEGKEHKEVPVCPPCHWALHYGNLEVRKRMKGKIHAWLTKQENEY
jgi:hypothetical protein